jgi:hypothetical protein
MSPDNQIFLRSRSRQLVFAAIIAALVFLVCELAAFLGLSLASKSWVTPSDLRDRRASAAGAGSGIIRGNEAVPEDQWYPQHAIHPYVGFVLDSRFRTTPRRESGGDEALIYGFELAQPGLFHPPESDQLVVGVIGGSVAFNFARNTAPKLRDRLGTLLGYPTERVVIIDIALPGFKQPQQLMALNYLLSLGIHLDVLVNMDGYNEIALPPLENLPHGVDASYPRRWHLRVADLDAESRLTMAELGLASRSRLELAQRFDRWPMRSSFIAGLVWSMLDGRLEREITRLESELAAAKVGDERSYSAAGPARTYDSNQEMLQDLTAIWGRASRLMHGVCEASGILYIHILQPNQYLPGSKAMGSEELAAAYLPRSLYGAMVKRGYPLMIEEGKALRGEGVRFLDLTMLYAEIEDPVYVDTCCHINELGETMIADALIEVIVAESRTK